MSNLTKENYTVLKTLDYDVYQEEEYNSEHWIMLDHETDIFNKSSKTTVCLDGAHRSRVMYCENCEETHYNQMAIEVEMRQYAENASGEIKIYPKKVSCKKCGSSYNIEDVRMIRHARHAQNSARRAVYDKIYNEDGLVKLSMKVCSMVVERGFYSVDNMYKIIFNTKTGQTYLYNNPLNKKNKVRPIIDIKLTLENIYLRGQVFDDMFNSCLFDTLNQEEYKVNKIKEIYTLIYKNICNNLGYNPKTLEDYAKEFHISDEKTIYSFRMLALYNRFPNFNPFGILFFNEYTYNRLYIFKRMAKIKNVSQQPLLELANLYKVEHFDLFEEYFYKKPKQFGLIIFLSNFFKEKESFEKILEIPSIEHALPSGVFGVNEFFKRKKSDDLENFALYFFKDMSKFVHEKDMCLIMTKYCNDYYFRTALDNITYFYYLLKKINKKFKVDLQHFGNLLTVNMDEEYTDESAKILENYIFTEFNNKAYNKNKKMFKFKLNTIEEYHNSLNTQYSDKNGLVSMLYYTVPQFNPYILTEMIFGLSCYTNLNSQKTEIEEMVIQKYLNKDVCDVLGALFNEFNIPNVKSLRSKIMKQPNLFPLLMFYSQSFTDVNAINNILDSVKERASSNMFSRTLNQVHELFFGDKEEVKGYNPLHKLNKCLIETFGEAIAAKKIASAYKNSQVRDMEDIWNMYEIHLQLYPGQPVDLTGNIKEIHDRLIALTGGAYRPFTEEDFKPFEYSKKEQELVTEIEGYQFNLVENGQELAILGNDLKNCVRSYVTRARKKQCYIVSVTNNDKYKICIELVIAKKEDGDYNYLLRQAKLFANTPIREDIESLNTVLKWMEMHKIKDSSGGDLGWSEKPVIEMTNYIQAQPYVIHEVEDEADYDEVIPF